MLRVRKNVDERRRRSSSWLKNKFDRLNERVRHVKMIVTLSSISTTLTETLTENNIMKVGILM